MKKVLLSIFAVFAFVAASNAQNVGVTLGANIANVGGDFNDQISPDSKFNLTVGLFAEFMLADKLGLQPELVFSGQGFKYNQDFQGTSVEYKQKLGYVNIPVLFNYYLSDNFYVQAGPYLGILTSAKASISGTLSLTDQDNKDSFESTDFGAMIGLGVKAGKFNFGARYQLGLANINALSDDTANNRVINIHAGFRFLNNN